MFFIVTRNLSNICISQFTPKKGIFIYYLTLQFFKCSCINYLLHTSVLSQKKKLKNFSLIFKSCILFDAGRMHHFVFVSLSTSICFSIYHITSFISKFTDMHKNKYLTRRSFLSSFMSGFVLNESFKVKVVSGEKSLIFQELEWGCQ